MKNLRNRQRLTMKRTKKEKDLTVEIEGLRLRLTEAVDTLRAIRSGEVDALVVSTLKGNQIYTLKGADRSYRLILETLHEGVLTMTGDGTIMYSNGRFVEMLSLPLQKVIGSSIYDFISPEDRPAFQAIMEQSKHGRSKGEILLTRKDETLIPVRLSLNPFQIDELAVVGVVAVDLTQQKETEKQLRHLSTQLLTAQENERRRIAGDIHDSIGGHLSAIKYQMETFFKQVPELSGAIFSAIQEAMNEARRIQMDLHPPTLDDLGIGPTLSWFCRRFNTTYAHIRIENEVGIEESEIPNSLKTVIYRISQEALNNVAKHSRADRVWVSLRKIDDAIELTIRDNGRGFNVGETISLGSGRTGLGLTSMRERAQLSGGSCKIESIPGKGTVVCASWQMF